MWDLKYYICEIWNILLINGSDFIYFFINFFNDYSNNGVSSVNKNFNYNFVSNSSIIFGVKFLLAIAFLVLIRGGTPRYRYDYLTKLGWLKFMSLIILIFFFSLLFYYIQ